MPRLPERWKGPALSNNPEVIACSNLYYMHQKYTQEILQKAVSASKCWREVCSELGIKPNPGSQRHLAKRAKVLGVNTDHFPGVHWSKGKKLIPRRSLQDYTERGLPVGSNRLRRKLIETGIKKAECEKCGGKEWRGRPIPLELDHINSDHWDNRLENLQILCPNCHYQETTDRKKTVPKRPKNPKMPCRDCRKPASRKRCRQCANKNRVQKTKIQWPSREELEMLVSKHPATILAKQLGVSDKAVEKRCKKLGIKKAARGFWAKQRAKTAKVQSTDP